MKKFFSSANNFILGPAKNNKKIRDLGFDKGYIYQINQLNRENRIYYKNLCSHR